MATVNLTPLNREEFESLDEPEETCFDDVLEELGPAGWFQGTQIAIFLALSFFSTMNNLSFVFFGYTPPHQCNKVNETELLSSYGLDGQNNTFQVEYKACEIDIINNETGKMKVLETLACPNGRTFTQYSTYIAYWDLVCESKGHAALTYTLFGAGRIVGGIIGSYIPDRFGRKRAVIGFSALSCMFEVLTIFSPSVFVLATFRFGSGFFYQTYSVSGFILISELVVSRHRQELQVWINLAWVVAALLLGALAYFLQTFSWKYLQILIATTFIVNIFQLITLKESMRWLTANNKSKDALDVLQLACKQNSKEFRKVKETYIAYTVNMLTNDSGSYEHIGSKNSASKNLIKTKRDQTKRESTTVLSILIHKKTITLGLVNAYIWLTSAMIYFGLYLVSTTLLGDRFLNFTLMTLVEFPSALFIPIVGSRVGRRALLLLLLVMTTLGMLISTMLTAFGKDSMAMRSTSTAFSVFGKFSIAGTFSFIYIVTSEIFPTNIRSTVTGFCSFVARFGMVMAPFLRPLAEIAIWAPGVVFTVMGAFAVLLALLLPETKNKDMPNTLSEFIKRDEKNEPVDS